MIVDKPQIGNSVFCQLVNIGACSESTRWACENNFKTWKEAFDKCEKPEWIFWVLCMKSDQSLWPNLKDVINLYNQTCINHLNNGVFDLVIGYNFAVLNFSICTLASHIYNILNNFLTLDNNVKEYIKQEFDWSFLDRLEE